MNAPKGVSRNAVRNPLEKWPKNGQHVLIPVEYSSLYTRTSIYKIERAMQEFHKRTCIRFIPKNSSHKDYVYFSPENFCYSEVGRKGGKQIVSLTKGCIRGSEGVAAIIHELMHTIGFYHEQSRADRDNYVTIHLENVLDDAKDNFDSYDLEKITHLGANYDYESIMHYDMYAFSKNGQPTIVPKKPGVTIGQRKGFSSIDIQKINKFYECGMDKKIHQTRQELSRISECPQKWTYFEATSKCYYVGGNDTFIYWADAKNECLKLESNLASIHSNEENVAIQKNGSWDNMGCVGKYWKRLYVCEKPSGMKKARQELPRISECPQKWTYFETTSKCYYVGGNDTFIYWADAKQECLKLKSNLASIHSNEENVAIQNLLKRTESSSWAWLGGQKIGNTWTWIDRTSWDYTNWSHPDPNP
uniref:Metalloendopeptidase n=1 Tax=Acrobeloides nanus TaxID=290746 RepID=A0A914EEY1_9BILA